MDDKDAMVSALVDHAIAAELVPFACPCDFGPDGRYRLEELVATSPHSFLYRATDQSLSSEGFKATVAIKILKIGSLDSHEALTTRRVDHANVLSVTDRGTTEDGMSYMVAEFVDGGDLGRVPIPKRPREAAQLMVKIARAVQAVHSAGIVHCDLKPANILLSRSGEPKLADFGFAHLRGDSGMTGRGNLAFMSPEQFSGEENALAPPSDIYALGGLLYYLLLGKLALGDTAQDIERAHRLKEAAPAPGISRDLDRICLRALAPNRIERYNSAGEMADDLERWLGSEPIPWAKPSAVRRLGLAMRRKPVRSVIAVCLAAAMIAAIATLQYNAARDRDRKAAAQEEAIQLAKLSVDQTSARVRRQIEWFYKTLTGKATGDLQDQFLPSLVWMQWLAESPVIQEDGQSLPAKERIGLLRTMIKSATDSGRASHLDVLIAKFACARLDLMDEEFIEARSYVEDVDRELGRRLSSEDPLRLSLAAMTVCADANAAIAQGQPVASVIAKLKMQDALLEQNGNAESTRRLVQSVLDRCAAAERLAR